MVRAAREVRIGGAVQGVGFRPFAVRLARELGIAGEVGNAIDGVVMTLEADEADVERYLLRLVHELPAPGRIESCVVVETDAVGRVGFGIRETVGGAGAVAAPPIVPDTAVCAACLDEMRDPRGRRHGYELVGCSQCGPRYTVTLHAPWQRDGTVMRAFEMCPDCRVEFESADDRRFHSELNACGACGPKATFLGPDGACLEGEEPVRAAALALEAGGVLGVKGLGGYHLACDATSDRAVAELRRRKRRPHRPLAVMVPDLEWGRVCAELDAGAEEILVSRAAPIVVVPQRDPTPIATCVAPGIGDIGLFLPYTPMHALLLDIFAGPLVLTSANHTDQPIVYEDKEAVELFRSVADGILTHDRPIAERCDDSVVRRRGGRTIPIRRSRGYVPTPTALPVPAPVPLLGVGGHLKCTVTLAKGDRATVGHHIGTLAGTGGLTALVRAVDKLGSLTGIEPEVVAHDLHPDYRSTQLARELDMPAVAVQHHHAHVASCMAEHGRAGRVLGVALDGHGLGPDGTSWGGEFLLSDLGGFDRVGHLLPVALPGGEAAIRDPIRMAIAWLAAAAGPDAARRWANGRVPEPDALISLCEWSVSSGRTTTGAGRLFDAVAALLDLGTEVTYEGQAAAELEALAHAAGLCRPFEVDVVEGATWVLDPRRAVAEIAETAASGAVRSETAASFHSGFAAAVARMALGLAWRHDVGTVVLTGGVFQNAFLLDSVWRAVEAGGCEVLTHRSVPPNDGGLSLGQAAVAAQMLSEEYERRVCR